MAGTSMPFSEPFGSESIKPFQNITNCLLLSMVTSNVAVSAMGNNAVYQSKGYRQWETIQIKARSTYSLPRKKGHCFQLGIARRALVVGCINKASEGRGQGEPWAHDLLEAGLLIFSYLNERCFAQTKMWVSTKAKSSLLHCGWQQKQAFIPSQTS